jgi:hypothetical protein
VDRSIIIDDKYPQIPANDLFVHRRVITRLTQRLNAKYAAPAQSGVIIVKKRYASGPSSPLSALSSASVSTPPSYPSPNPT